MAEKNSNVVLNFKTNGEVQYAKTISQINMVMTTAAKEYTNHVAAMGKDADMTEKLAAEKKKLETQMNASTEKVRMLREEYEAMSGDTNATAEQLQKLYNQLLAAENANTKLETSMKRVSDGLSDNAIASREAKDALKELQVSGASLEVEQRKLTSAFELEAAQLGDNATEAEKLELAQRKLVAQTDLAGRSIKNMEEQLEQARIAYGDNSDEVMKMEIKLNQAKTTVEKFGDGLGEVEGEAEEAENSLDKLGGAFQALGGVVAGLGLAGIISSALEEANTETAIDITFNVPEDSKQSIRSALSDVKKYGIEGEEAMEGLRRQWALNKDASDEMNRTVVEGAAVITRSYTGLDFVEVVQEVNEISKELETTNEEALDLVYNLLSIGFPPEQLDIISEYGNQLQRLGYTAKEVQGLFAAAVDTGSWNIDNLLDGLKEGRIRATEFGQGLSESMKDSIRAVKGGTKEASEEQLDAMQDGFERQEKALNKSIASRSEALSRSHEQQKRSLTKALDDEFKAASKNYSEREKALERHLSASYDKTVKRYENQQQALEKSLDAEFKAVSKSHAEQEKSLEKRLTANYDKTVKSYEDQQRALERNLDLEVTAFEKASEKKLKLIDAEYYARLKLVDEERYNQLKALDAQISALDAKTEAENRALKKREDAEKRAELRSRISSAKTSKERADAVKALREFEEKLKLESIREERKKQIDVIKAEKETVKEVTDAKKESIKEEQQKAKEAAQAKNEIEKNALKQQQENRKEIFEQEKKDTLNSLSEKNKAELESQKQMLASKREALKSEQDDQKAALKERNAANLKSISESNKAQMESLKESSSANLAALKEQQEQRKTALDEQLSLQSESMKAAHAEELESFKKMNDEKMELAKNPPDSAAVQALFKQLEGWGAAVAKGGEEGTQAFEDMVRWLDSIEDATLRNALGTEIFGTMWEDQGENIIDTVLNADGALKDMGKSQKDLQDAIDATDRNPLVEIASAYEGIKESLSPLLIVVADVVGAFAKFAAEHPKITSAFVAIAGVVAVLVGAFAALAPAIAAVPALIPILTSAFASVAGVVTKLGPVFNILRLAMMALSGPIVWVSAAVVALAVVIFKNWDDIKRVTVQVFGSIVDFIKEWGGKLINGISKPVMSAVGFVVGKWKEIKKSTSEILGDVIRNVKENFQKIKDSISRPITDAKNTVSRAITEIKGFFKNLVLKFPKLNTEIFETARKAVKRAIDAIKGFFNFEFKWPELKMPKFEVKGSMNPLTWFDQGVPTIDVKWNAKGGIFTKPTIFGQSGGTYQGAGEAGPEAVLPLNEKTLGEIGRSIAATMDIPGGGDMNLTVEIPMDGEVIARKTIKYTMREMYDAQQTERRGRR